MAVNIRDVAARAGVSVGTVSNVLNSRGNVTAEAAERVHDAIAALGYVRNDAARQLRAGRSRSIGLIVLDVGNPFFADIARGAQERAAEDGLAVLLAHSDGDANRERLHLDLFREQRVNGILITPATDDLDALVTLSETGTPVVLVDRDAPESGLRSVAVDDVEGGYLAASHILAGGRRRLAFVAGPRSTRQVADRLEGARRAAAQFPGARLEVVDVAAMTVLAGRSAGEQLLDRPARERPDGIVAANDLLAIGVLQALSLTGALRVPEDVALIGYDDIDFASAAVVPLSSIRQPAQLIGYTAVDVLLRSVDDTATPSARFEPLLIARQSTLAKSTAEASEAQPETTRGTPTPST